MMVYHPMNFTRRHWLSTCTALAGLPEVASALQHANAVKQAATAKFETLDPATAGEIEAIAAQIIPSVDGPGAREAGVIYFIDRALATFAAGDVDTYRTGMQEVQQKRRELFPVSVSIAALTPEQSLSLVRAIETSRFFELLRTHTVLGFLGDPSYGGNRGGVGWQQIGFDNRMAYHPPFGYYDAEEAAKGDEK